MDEDDDIILASCFLSIAVLTTNKAALFQMLRGENKKEAVVDHRTLPRSKKVKLKEGLSR